MSDPVFLYGTLRDAELLRIIIGDQVDKSDAILPDFEVQTVEGQAFPMVVNAPGLQAPGLLLNGLSDDQVARLSFYEGPFAYDLVPMTVTKPEGPVSALVYMPQPGKWRGAGAWDISDWQDRFGPLRREAAVEIMAYYGRFSTEDVAARMPMIEARAQSALNARARGTPQVLRKGLTTDDVVLEAQDRTYSRFFALDDMTLRYRQFSGQISDPVDRAVFVAADAVTVLPYDPMRDSVLLIEQFRVAMYRAGDKSPWALEAIAGRIDAYETAEQAARREAQEEAGVALGDLHKIAGYYPSTGGSTEHVTSYIGIADLPDEAAGLGGLDSEDEDIRSLVIPFETLMTAVASGEIENAPLLLSAYWLAAHRGDLRVTG